MNEAHPSPVPEPPQFDLLKLAAKLDFVVIESLLPDLQVETKTEAISRMVAALASAEAIPRDREAEILAAVWHREQQATTGIGRGIAIPHAKHPAVQKVVATMAYCRAGIDFDSLDGQNVHLIFLVLSPVDQVSQHLQALQQVTLELIQSEKRN